MPDQSNVSTVIEALATVGYVARRREALAVTGLLTTPPEAVGARALLLEGPPGAGKSALAEAVAHAWGWPLVVAQLHAWTDADELFVGVDVAAAVAGAADQVRQDGVLAVAARASQQAAPGSYVVLLLDEIDKTSERAEALLLDWLQSGRVPLQPGVHLQTDLSRVLVFVTSNAMRTLSDALLRRLRRCYVEPLPVDLTEQLIARMSGIEDKGLARVAWRLAREIAEADGAVLSPQEGARLIRELVTVAASVLDVREVLAGWAARGGAGRDLAAKTKRAPELWAEVARVQQRGA
jgi:MoxR-like ATPase